MPQRHHILSLLFAGVVVVAVFLSRAEDAVPKVDLIKSSPDQTPTELVATLLPPPPTETGNVIIPPPAVQLASGLVVDLSLNKEIFSLNPAQRWPLASLTKLMTAVVALENIPNDKQIIFTADAVAADGNGGHFQVGETFSKSDLIKAMMVVSSNDAAVALAESFDDGLPAFVTAMSAKAAELHMNQSSFFDPSGLDIANQSNIRDIEKLVVYAYRFHPEIFKWSAAKSAVITEWNSQTARIINNINLFASQEDFAGGKTGYLTESNGNLVSLFSQKGRIILIIVLGAEDRFGETEKLWKYYKSLGF